MPDINIIKPDPDYKSYRYLQLPNGLRAILVSNVKPGEVVEPIEISRSDDNEEVGSQTGSEDVFESELRKSAAALCVHVGSFSDPVEAQGLAHFLEHMLFMGSEKYPRENDFDDYVSHRDGSSNASTEGDCTTFYFDVQRNYFREALDKFANFFVAPLLRKSCVDRELEAVDSEFELSKVEDYIRFCHLITQLSNPGSPYRLFSCGNRVSLNEEPSVAGTDIYELLRNFQRKYYNASLMTLAVESRDTLDNLEAMVKEIFSPLPNRKCEAPDFSGYINPFSTSVYRKLYKIVPVKEATTVEFIWSLPPMQSHYRSAVLKFVSTIIGHEGEGSLLSILRKKNLALKLTAGCSGDSFFDNDMTTLFEIKIGLSDFSRSNPIQLADYVFPYLRMLRDAANFSLANPTAERTPWGDRSFASLIPEFQQLWAAAFRFQEPMEPQADVQVIARALQRYPPEEVIAADRIMFESDLKVQLEAVPYLGPTSSSIPVYENLAQRVTFSSREPRLAILDLVPNILVLVCAIPTELNKLTSLELRASSRGLIQIKSTYVDLVNFLTPEKAIMTISLPEYVAEAAGDVACKVFLKERWYGIRYAVEEIPDQDLARWKNTDALPDFHLPEVNRFITTKFDILPRAEDNEMPREVNLGSLQKFGELWHQQRTKYNVPMAQMQVHLYSDAIQTPKDAVLMQVWILAFNKRLLTRLYSATEANFEFSVSVLPRGIEVAIVGFTEKLLLLYQEIISLLKKPLVAEHEEDCLMTEASFSVLKDSIRQSMCNRLLNSKKLNNHIRKYFRQINIHAAEDTMNALEALTLSDILDFAPRFLSRLYIKMLLFGNVTARDAVNFFQYTLSTLNPSEAAILKPYAKANIPPGVNRIRVQNFNTTDVNMCLTLINPVCGTPSGNLRAEVLCHLLANILNEPAFGYLRTKETLGYSVSLFAWQSLSTTGQAGISVAVQSQANKFDCNLVAGRMYAFWYGIVPQIIFHLKEESFETAVEAVIASNMTEDSTMDMEVNRVSAEVFADRHVFDRRQRYIEILKRLNIIDLQEFYTSNFYAIEKQPSIMVQVDAVATSGEGGENDSKSSKGSLSNSLKTYRWPLSIVPMSANQIEAEREAALSVEVEEAVKACAPDLVKMTASSNGVVNGDEKPVPNAKGKAIRLPRFNEIVDIREFKHRVLFPN
ncbi:hypothetical protein Aperf_G00000119016 [Anoplocephala perfoliata]